MDEKIYVIILADGTEISDLRLNGSNYISKKPLDETIFDNNCSPVLISNGEVTETHENMEFVQITIVDGEYWLVLRDISEEELNQIKLRADVEYLAMMSGVEL